MAKKKPDTPKLDATVKSETGGMKFVESLPAYVKPYDEFARTCRTGQVVTIWKRTFDLKNTSFKLIKISGVVYRKYPRSVVIVDAESGEVFEMPWWTIHNWEISAVGNPEIDAELLAEAQA
jgi:hypothetical protein